MDRLERSESDRFLFGVCGGLAANLEIDSVLVRFVFAIAGLATGGTAVIGYLLLAILMPSSSSKSRDGEGADEESTESSQGNDISDNLEQLRREAYQAGERFKFAVTKKRTGHPSAPVAKKTWGIIAVVLGALLLGSNLGWYGWFGFGEWWPILIIAGGVALLVTSQRRSMD